MRLFSRMLISPVVVNCLAELPMIQGITNGWRIVCQASLLDLLYLETRERPIRLEPQHDLPDGFETAGARQRVLRDHMHIAGNIAGKAAQHE